MIHYFVTCPKVAVFWDAVFNFINKQFHSTLQPDVNNILFGILSVPPITNLLIILAKHHIYYRNTQKLPLDLQAYLAYVTETYKIERQAAAGCQKQELIMREKWKGISTQM